MHYPKLVLQIGNLLKIPHLGIWYFFLWEIGTLSIDNETHDDDASQPRQTGPRVSFQWGKRSLSSAASQTDGDFFFAKEFVLLQSCYGIQRPP